ncbi:MAG: coenzyme A pyrophosphatase [Magnetovibrio sp.]|nr:coenzyme A pyrophosphatase [Magnetovibrio sp.]
MDKPRYLTKLTNRKWMTERLRKNKDKPLTQARGDHDLNPGTRSKGPFIPAAVLIPLVLHEGNTTVLLTRRTENLAKHPGQISFPGGHMEDFDGTPEETALRETEEEIGLNRCHVDIIGRLNNYETRTGFRVTPIVAFVTPPFNLTQDFDEVAEFFEVPTSFLLDPVNHRRHNHIYEGTLREFYTISYNQYSIWGVTAGILVNFSEALESS